MSMPYPNVYEAFHAAPAKIHAHGSLDSTENAQWQDADGSNISHTLTQGDMLYSDANVHIGTYNGTEWYKTNLADITTVDELKGLLTSSKTFSFGLANELSNPLDNDNYNDFLYHSVNDFLRATHSIKDSEEIKAINSYVETLQKDENHRLGMLGDKFRNNVMTTKHMYMMVNRDAHKIRSNIRLIMFSIVFASIIMCLMPSHQTTWAKILMAFAILVFFTYAVLHVRRDKSRRFKDFSKYFFTKGDLPESKVEESVAGDEVAEDRT